MMATQMELHAEAAPVAEALRSQGLPVMGVELFDAGFRIGVAFRMPWGAVMAFSFPKAEAQADPELFAAAYREACLHAPAVRKASNRGPITEGGCW